MFAIERNALRAINRSYHYLFLEQLKQFVHLLAQLLVGHDFVVDIHHREDDADALLLEEGVEGGLAQAVAFAREASHTVAVDGMLEFPLGGDDEDLARSIQWAVGSG